MIIIDNFLNEEYFKTVQNHMMGTFYSWHWCDGIVDPNDGKHQLVNLMFDVESENVILDDFYSCIHPMLDKINKHVPIKQLLKIKCNFTYKTIEHEHGGLHIDYKDATTAIFYINTNNGWTNFKNGAKVESIENRLVIFDSNLEHEGVTCTDEIRKMVINFNYVPA